MDKKRDPKWVDPKKHLGVSQYAAALGLNNFLCPDGLKDRLERGYKWEGNPSLNFGHNKERLAKYYYIKLTKNKVKRAYLVKDINYPRLVGIADGLVGDDGGLEIKCHYLRKTPIREIPIDYLVQVAGYLNLYNKRWWDFMSCCFNDKNELDKCKIIRVYREDIQDAWDNEWLPGILKFMSTVKWIDQ